MWQLFHCDDTDDHWQCFMMLQEISSIILSPIISVEQLPYLRLLIHDYLKSLYPVVDLTPKCHFLILDRLNGMLITSSNIDVLC